MNGRLVLPVLERVEDGAEVHRRVDYLQVVLGGGGAEGGSGYFRYSFQKTGSDLRPPSLSEPLLEGRDMWRRSAHRVFLQVHRLPEGLRVFALEDEIQQVLAAPPPGVRVVRGGAGPQLPPRGSSALRGKSKRRITASTCLVFQGVRLLWTAPGGGWGLLPCGFAWTFQEC